MNIFIFTILVIALIAIAVKMNLVNEIHKLFKFIKGNVKTLLISLFIGVPITWALFAFILCLPR